MAEHEGVVSVAGADGGVAAAAGESETLMVGCENRNEEPLCEEDGGEIMVEVVGSDVFVDGIPGQLDEENLGGEDGGGAEEDLRSADKAEDLEAKIATPVEELQDVAGSSEEDAQGIGEEGEQLVSREVEVSSVVVTEETTTLNEEAQDSEIPSGEGVALVERTEVVTETVVETVVTTVSEANASEGLVEDGAEEGDSPGELAAVGQSIDPTISENSLNQEDKGPVCDMEEAKSTHPGEDHNSGAEIVSEPTSAVADTEMETTNDKVSLDVVEQTETHCEVTSRTEVTHSGTVTLVCSERELLTTPNEVVGAADENLDYEDNQMQKIGGAEEAETDQTEAVSKNEVIRPPVVESNFPGAGNKTSKSDLESPKSDDTDLISACFEDEQNLKHGVCVSHEEAAHVHPDPKSSDTKAHFAEIGKVPAVNLEDAMDIEGEVAEVAAGSGEDQCPEVDKAVGAVEIDEKSRELESPGEEIQKQDEVMVDAVIEGGETVPDSKFDVLDAGTCLKKDDELNTGTGGQITEDGSVKVSAEASDEKNKTGNSVNAILEEPPVGGDSPPSANHNLPNQIHSDSLEQEKVPKTGNLPTHGVGVQSTAMLIVDDHGAASEKGNKLDTELSHANSEDLPVDNDTLTVKESNSAQTHLGKNYPSLPDKEEDMLAQTAETHTHETDGVQSMNSETMAEKVPSVERQVQAVGSFAGIHDECDPVPSSVSKFAESLPVCSDAVVKSEEEGKSCEAEEALPGDQVLDKCMEGSLVVDFDTCLANEGKWKSEGEFVNENLAVPEESLFTGDDDPGSGGNVELEFSDCVVRNATSDICLDGPTIGQEVGGQEHFAKAEIVDPYEGQDIELDEQVADKKEAKDVDECSEESLRPGTSAVVHEGNYLLSLENEGKFGVSDLVWGKVKSHPWWPGQIFDPSDASEKALKHQKRDSFLVAYFGDRTFAWNEASLLKPFWTNFSKIVRQSSSEAFQNSVSCALEEVSRRVQLGLACSCVKKDVYEKIVHQNVQNTGIREDSDRKSSVEKFTGACSFAPHKLVEYMKKLAHSPSAEVDQLELVIAKAQLLAFNRSKDCYRLPSFQFCGGLLDDSNSSEFEEVIDNTSNNAHVVSSKPDAEKSSSLKRKHNLKDSLYPRKKEKSLRELTVDVVSSPDSEDVTDIKTSNTLVYKRKGVDSVSDCSEPQDRRISIYAAKVSTAASPAPKPSFKVGECISRIAGQLWSPSILKGNGGEKFRKVELRSDDSIRDDAPLQTPDDHQRGKIICPTECASADEMLSQLHMVAREPMQTYGSISTIMPFFSDFRDSISLVHQAGRQNSSTGRPSGGRKRKVSQSVVGTPEEFEFDDVNDSYWTDRIIENGSEEQAMGDTQNSEQYQLMAIDLEKSLKSNRRPNSRKRFSNGNHEMTLVPVSLIDERKRDNSPAELMLNFCEGDRIPSEMKLTNIFRRFGPLKESETEIDLENSRARVVFRRGSDAEVALSSSEKFSIFGSMIVGYQINYSPSNSLKDFPPATSEEHIEAL